MTSPANGHARDCDFHVDQYPWECTCGATRKDWIIGIDPGLSGGVAFYHTQTGALEVHDMPVLDAGKGSRKEIDLLALAEMLDRKDVHHAYIERVHAMPKQGVTSVWRFSEAAMAPRAVLAAYGIAHTLVTPQSWKRSLSVPAAKDGARARAGQLLPRHAGNWKLKKHDGRAEAALIALYGARSLGLEAAA